MGRHRRSRKEQKYDKMSEYDLLERITNNSARKNFEHKAFSPIYPAKTKKKTEEK